MHTVSFLGNFYADYAITGASGLAADGPSEALLECGAVYTAMVARAAKCVVVADHSKFDAIFPSRYAPWRDVDALVTDAPPPEKLAVTLRQSGVELVRRAEPQRETIASVVRATVTNARARTSPMTHRASRRPSCRAPATTGNEYLNALDSSDAADSSSTIRHPRRGGSVEAKKAAPA